MSTLPGLASKGEKGKSKYQSLDINNLWKAHTGESLETQHQKNTLPRKHGMQSLGKVPTARRPPANLPSLKSEHTGSDAAVSLVPSGGTGWGKQEGSPSSTTTSSQTTSVTNSTVNSSSNNSSNSIPISNQTAGTSPATTSSLPISKQSTPTATPVTSDKSWSAVMSGNDILQPPPYHSPQFQHEFPSLSAGDGAPTRPGTDMQYGPGPSLRPQNEGSWIQGGSRPPSLPTDLHSRNSNSAPPGAAPQLSGPAGPPQMPLPQQFRGVMPPFMCRGSFAPNGHGIPNFSNPPTNSGKWSASGGGGGPNRGALEGRQQQQQLPQRPDEDEVVPRPIIKEEDLSRMDDLGRDVGWASYDDIDYNQKLAFSDDESSKDDKMREGGGRSDHNSLGERRPRQQHHGGGGGNNPKIIRHINNEEDEVWKQRRMQQNEKLALVVEKAKQRKEEEEKRFFEQKQAAAKKLQMLEEKMNKNKRDREQEDTQGTISPMAVPPQPIVPAPIPIPEWEKEKEQQQKSQTTTTTTPSTTNISVVATSSSKDTTTSLSSSSSSASEFHKLTQIEGRSFVRKDSHSVERDQPTSSRDIVRDQMGPNFSKQFQSNLPPRFKKQQQMRNIASSPQLQTNNMQQSYSSESSSSYGSWQFYKSGASGSVHNVSRQDSEELDDQQQQQQHKEGHNRKEESSYSGFNPYYDSDVAPQKSHHQTRSDDEVKRQDKTRDDAVVGGWGEKEKDVVLEKTTKRTNNHHNHNHNHHHHHHHQQQHQQQKQQDMFEEFQMHHASDEWRIKDDNNRYERPQRPDSRDSRASRDSRHSRESNRDFDYHTTTSSSSWADSPFEPQTVFDKKQKDNIYSSRDERSSSSRVVPGPITKERVEAEDYKNEKVLTQLKRVGGALILDKTIDKEKTSSSSLSDNNIAKDSEEKEQKDSSSNDNKHNKDDKGATVASTTTTTTTTRGKENEKESCNNTDSDSKQTSNNSNLDKDDKQTHVSNRRRQDSRPWSNGGGFIYRNSWKRNDNSRRGVGAGGGGGMGGSRFGGIKKQQSSAMGKGPNDWPHTESEASADEISSEGLRDDKRSPKMPRRSSKDEKNKENRLERDSNKRDSYTPRGEPSRHGRGSSHFRSGRGGLTKRIDGYGPPPSKSPFSHTDDKESGKKGENALSESEERQQQQQGISASAGVIGSNRNRVDIGKSKMEDKSDGGNKSRGSSNSRRNKGRKTKEGFGGSEENCETSDNSEENTKDKSRLKGSSNRTLSQRRNNNNRSTAEYRGPNMKTDTLRQSKDDKIKNQDDMSSGDQAQKEEKDTDGFQEVKSKKNVQRQQKPGDEKVPIKIGGKTSVDDRRDKPLKKTGPGTAAITVSSTSNQQFPLAQQVANIPSLMDTPINPPPPMLAQLNKDKFDRNRQNKLPPRFVRQRENSRLQKVQIHHHEDINKINHNDLNILDSAGALSSAWNKLRVDSDALGECGKNNVTEQQQQQQQSSPNQSSPASSSCIDKVVQSNHLGEKPVLDGATPPVNTIIFENTNFKSAPGAPRRNEKASCKIEDGGVVVIDNATVMSNFNKPIRDLLGGNNKNDKQQQQHHQQVDAAAAAAIQMQLSFTKEDSADMKLDFFESELTHLTEDKNSKNLGMPRSIHTITSVNSTISTADALNFKIASVKKVWESMPTVMEHNVVVAQDDANAAAAAGFSTSFVAESGTLDGSTAFVNKAPEAEDVHERYNASPNQTVTNNTTTNVCKVKPTQQIAGSTGQAIHTTGAHQPHSGVVGPGIVGHPLSPPPMQPVIGTGVGLGQPPQQYTSNQHLGYQPSVGGTNQYGMSAIPSPPTVLFNSTQQLQAAAAAQSGLYGAFQIDQSQVLGSQGRSQFSQYPNPYGLGQTTSSPYSAQSMYLQGAQPHPPPAAQPPPDLYTNINSYRLSATGPFAQNQQLNNPTTVLISSTSNSLMSATVKPSTQQISAIGTKAGGAGQAYQQTSQQGQQLYMAYDPTMQAASYLPSTGVIQRGPNGPIQNNVVTALQPSASSFYTGSTGGQTAGFFQQPASSALQSAPLQQHQAGYGMQGNMFGTPNQSHTSAGLQNFSSHFLSSPMQLAAAAALNAQQYRSPNMPNTTPYIKSMTGQHVGDQGTRQLKSPASQQDVLSSVFNSGPQIPSPKSKQNPKQPPPQSSPTAQHKYNLYQSVNTQQMAQMQRYPGPIQRPMNFQSSMGGSVQSATNGPSSNNPKHRSSNQNQKMRHYYGSQGTNLGNSNNNSHNNNHNNGNIPQQQQHDKMDEKLSESSTNNSNSATSSNGSNNNTVVVMGGGVGGSASGGGNAGGGNVSSTVVSDPTIKDHAKNEEVLTAPIKE